MLAMLVPTVALITSCESKKEEQTSDIELVKDGASKFVICRPDNASNLEKNATVALKKAITEMCGVELAVKTDYVPRNDPEFEIPKYEILVGETNREEAKGLVESLGEDEYVIKASGTKFIICGKTDKMTESAVSYFINTYLAEEKTTFSFNKDFLEKGIGDYTYCSAEGMSYVDMAREVYKDFLARFWKGKWVTGSGFWDAAEILETFIDAYEATRDAKYLQYVKDYAKSFESRHGTNWLSNEFNDDVMWITIAYLRIYKLTGEKSYYTQAKKMYDGVYARAWDKTDGGLFWKTDNKSKNSCINCPGAIAAAMIGEITNDEKYTNQAKAMIDWVVANLYGGKGYVYDSVNLSGEINKWASTYNQGTFIGANMLIYQNTGDETYKQYADDAVNYTIKNMFNNGVINSEGGENGDLHGFKGILTRWMYRYAKFTNDIEILEWLQLNAATAYSNRNNKGLIWTTWNDKSKDFTGELPEHHTVFGYSTAVALMFNSLQWWNVGEPIPKKQ